jgi:hypothetical protein
MCDIEGRGWHGREIPGVSRREVVDELLEGPSVVESFQVPRRGFPFFPPRDTCFERCYIDRVLLELMDLWVDGTELF